MLDYMHLLIMQFPVAIIYYQTVHVLTTSTMGLGGGAYMVPK